MSLAEFQSLRVAEMAALGAEAELAAAEAYMPRLVGGIAGTGALGLAVGEYFIHAGRHSRETNAQSARTTPFTEDLAGEIPPSHPLVYTRDPDLGGTTPAEHFGGRNVRPRRSSPISETVVPRLTNDLGRRPADMPYTRKTSGYTRKRTGKSGYAKRGPARAPRVTTQKLKRVVYSIAEKKYVDVAGTMANPVNLWTSQIIGPMLTPGTAVSNRQGNRVNVRYLEVQHFSQPTSQSTFNGANLRCLFVWRKENDGQTSLLWQDLFVENRQMSIRNQEKMGSVKILADWNTIIPAGSSVGIDVRKIIRVNMPVTYTGTAGTGADLNAGCIYFFCYNTNPNGDGSANITCTSTIRVHFTDL